MPLLQGFVIGLGLAFLIGPVFFTLLKASLQQGVWSGLAVAFGIFLSDILCVVLCVLGTAKYLNNEENQAYLAMGGGIILLGLGVNYVVRPKVSTGDDVKVKTLDYIGYAVKGFLVNFLNPFVFFIWISIIAASGYTLQDNLTTYLIGVLAGIFLTDSLKAILATKIRHFIKPHILVKLFRVIGVCLIVFAIRLFYVGVEFFKWFNG